MAPAPDRTQLARTGLLWAVPLALAPPLFSKDVYSYLAQSAITARGFDPYSLGPAATLGVDDPLTRTIPTIWRDTPAPYGPLFLHAGARHHRADRVRHGAGRVRPPRPRAAAAWR